MFGIFDTYWSSQSPQISIFPSVSNHSSEVRNV